MLSVFSTAPADNDDDVATTFVTLEAGTIVKPVTAQSRSAEVAISRVFDPGSPGLAAPELVRRTRSPALSGMVVDTASTAPLPMTVTPPSTPLKPPLLPVVRSLIVPPSPKVSPGGPTRKISPVLAASDPPAGSVNVTSRLSWLAPAAADDSCTVGLITLPRLRPEPFKEKVTVAGSMSDDVVTARLCGPDAGGFVTPLKLSSTSVSLLTFDGTVKFAIAPPAVTAASAGAGAGPADEPGSERMPLVGKTVPGGAISVTVP